MTLYLALDKQRPVWVVKLTYDAVMYCYDGHLDRFCQSHSLYADFYFDQELRYQALSVEQAKELIAAGVGLYDLNALPWLPAKRALRDWMSIELAMQGEPLTEHELQRKD